MIHRNDRILQNPQNQHKTSVQIESNPLEPSKIARIFTDTFSHFILFIE